MIKFADDSEITGKIKNDDDFVYMEERNSFVKWYDYKYLCLNFSKMKEMHTDFRKNRSEQRPVWINGKVVDQLVYKITWV